MWFDVRLSVMTRGRTLLPLVVASSASVFACASSAEPTRAAEEALARTALRCEGDGTTFDLAGQAGTLVSGDTTARFECRQSTREAATPDVLLRCAETAGEREVTIAKQGDSVEARLGAGTDAPLVLRCSAPAPERAPAAASAAVPTYDEMSPIIAANCGRCHRATFATLERVRARRPEMLLKLSRGEMPRDEPTWFRSPDGQRLLAFLRESPELD